MRTSKKKVAKSPYNRTRSMVTSMIHSINGYDQYTVTNGIKTQGPKNTQAGLSTDISTKKMDDVVTPGFAQRSADGSVYNNPMTSVTKEYIQQCASSFEASGTTGGTTTTWKMWGFPRSHVGPLEVTEAVITNVANLQRLCQTGALSGVQTPMIQGLVTLGESKSTLAMLANPLKGFGKVLRQKLKTVSKLKPQRSISNKILSKKTGKAVKNPTQFNGRGVNAVGNITAASVLGVNLGWVPFLKDIDTILHEIPLLENEERRTSRKKIYAIESSETRKAYTIPYTGISATRIRKYTEMVTVRSGVLYADSFEPTQHFGIRLADIPEAMWELVPLSFVFDYFVNVGDYIGAMRAQAFSKVLASWTTTEIDTTVEERFEIQSLPSPYKNYSWGNPVGVTRQVTKTREPNTVHAGLAYSPLQIALRPPARVQNLLGLTILQLTKLSSAHKVR